MQIQSLDSLSQIPDYNYTGYYWASDSQNPVEISSFLDLVDFEKDGMPTNPFILEAHLYAAQEQVSISIKQVGSGYLIHQYNVGELQPNNLVKRSYLADKSFSKPKLVFNELWLAQQDKNCCDLDVLVKTATVFCGFADEESK